MSGLRARYCRHSELLKAVKVVDAPVCFSAVGLQLCNNQSTSNLEQPSKFTTMGSVVGIMPCNPTTDYSVQSNQITLLTSLS